MTYCPPHHSQSPRLQLPAGLEPFASQLDEHELRQLALYPSLDHEQYAAELQQLYGWEVRS